MPVRYLHEFIVGPKFSDTAFMKERDPVCLPDGGKAVSYCYHRPILHNALQSFLNKMFALCIKGTKVGRGNSLEADNLIWLIIIINDITRMNWVSESLQYIVHWFHDHLSFNKMQNQYRNNSLRINKSISQSLNIKFNVGECKESFIN